MLENDSDMPTVDEIRADEPAASDPDDTCDANSPPPWLPRHPSLFWGSAARLDGVTLTVEAGTGALAALGPPPFPRSGFPFSGFLATVFDHVSAQCQGGAGA